MVKAYLRYELSASFGVVNSDSNIIYDKTGRNLITGTLENVSLWNLRQGNAVKTLVGPRGENDRACPEVTCLAYAPENHAVAAGYSDGSIRIWDLERGACDITLQGHKSAVTALRFDAQGSLLASGSKDTDIVLWDVMGESGLFRLRGHRGQVTDLVFIPGHPSRRLLVSASKDQLVKVWDLDAQHCCQTVVGHHSEVWSLDVNPSGTRIVTGSSEADLHVYRVRGAAGVAESDEEGDAGQTGTMGEDGEGAAVMRGKDDFLVHMGALRRQSLDRVGLVRFDASGLMLCAMSAGKVVEFYRVRNEAEVAKHLKRRKKRRVEKERKKGAAGAAPAPPSADDPDVVLSVTASDEMAPHVALRLKHKARSLSFAPPAAPHGKLVASGTTPSPNVAISLINNSIEVYALPHPGQEAAANAEPDRVGQIDLPGHRSDIRSLALSPDDSLLLSTSSSGSKLWNPRTGGCIRTIEEGGYGLSAVFAPGGRHAVVGTKEGKLEILDVAAGQLLESIGAHEGAIWSVCPLPDNSGVITGSADHDVKFWEYELKSTEEGRQQLSVRHTRTLKMSDDVLCVAASPDGKLLALSLLDSTIKVFFLDTLKFFLSLYGHKLPALSIDISSDGTLLASGGADKNLRVWGLDFGDCHRSLFAHQDSVMQVKFVRNTHYCFTSGKDKTVRYWDCDKFEQLLVLEGHHAEVWALAVSHLGDFVVTGGHDRSIRRWERTDEPFFVEEEKEKRLEAVLEEGGAGDQNERAPEGEAGAAGPAGRRTLDSVTAAENLSDSLELAENEQRRLQAEAEARASGRKPAMAPTPNPLLLGMDPSSFLWRTLTSIPSSDLEQTLLVLPFSDALRLIQYLPGWLSVPDHVELSVRVSTNLIRIHQQQLSSTPDARPALLKLHRILRPSIQRLKDAMGFNMAALRMVQRMAAARATVAGSAAEEEDLEGGRASLKRKLAEAKAEARREAVAAAAGKD